MEKVKDLIKEYLINTIQTKKNMRKRIYQLEERVKEAEKNEQYSIEQTNKYKTKCKLQNKKINELKQKLKEKK